MQISCSVQSIVDLNRPKQGIRDMYKAGFENVVFDYSLACSDIVLGNKKTIVKKDLRIEDVKELTNLDEKIDGFHCVRKEVKALCNTSTVVFPSDYLNKLPDELIKTISIESIKKSQTQLLSNIIIQSLFSESTGKRIYEDNSLYFIELAALIKDCSLTILIKNQCKNINGHYVRGFCSDEVKAAQFVDELNCLAEEKYGQRMVNGEKLPYFGFCMDVGTCNLCGQNMYDFAVALGSRIKAVILRDCNGNQDVSMLPFTSVNKQTPQTDWLNLIRGLRKIRFDGELIMDFSDTAAAFSPILKPQLLALAKFVADYFKWQIEIESLLDKYPSRVLFGAGNMCRNYVKNYGDKYPPLFTCDNNKNIWGQVFEGLEVKNPECLKALPEDTAIFICNIFYREIEEQLRNMGLTNPIEYFNDEYMPSFHFNRIDAVTRKMDKEEE